MSSWFTGSMVRLEGLFWNVTNVMRIQIWLNRRFHATTLRARAIVGLLLLYTTLDFQLVLSFIGHEVHFATLLL